jgi:hypothetical protein
LALPFAGSGGIPQSARVQVGCTPLQVPSAWQVRFAGPVMEKQLVQVYVAVELYVVPVWLTKPDAMDGVPQSTTVQVGGFPLQVRSDWQVCAVVSDSLYPGLHAYVAVEPKVVPVVVGAPLGMLGGSGQSARPQLGVVPLQLPSA